jgi:hypothetical protein
MASWCMTLFGSMLLTVAVVVMVVVSLILGLVGLLETVADVAVRMLLWRLMKDLFIQLLENSY